MRQYGEIRSSFQIFNLINIKEYLINSFFRVSFTIICKLFTVILRTSLRENVLYNFMYLQFSLEVEQLQSHCATKHFSFIYLSVVSYIWHSLLLFYQKKINIFVLNEDQEVHFRLTTRWHCIECSNLDPLLSCRSHCQWQLCNVDAAQNDLCEVWCEPWFHSKGLRCLQSWSPCGWMWMWNNCSILYRHVTGVTVEKPMFYYCCTWLPFQMWVKVVLKDERAV